MHGLVMVTLFQSILVSSALTCKGLWYFSVMMYLPNVPNDSLLIVTIMNGVFSTSSRFISSSPYKCELSVSSSFDNKVSLLSSWLYRDLETK